VCDEAASNESERFRFGFSTNLFPFCFIKTAYFLGIYPVVWHDIPQIPWPCSRVDIDLGLKNNVERKGKE
jgi:hypothetical protein